MATKKRTQGWDTRLQLKKRVPGQVRGLHRSHVGLRSVVVIEGLCIASEDNEVSVFKTVMENLRRLPEGHKRFAELRSELFQEFQPDCVITDFEPMTAYLAHSYDIPLITIDNQHRMRSVKYDCPSELRFEKRVTKNIIRDMVPHPDVSLVTTFSFGELHNELTTLA